MRLIDADALADALFEKRKNYPQWVADTIGNMPEAVVRCKDCANSIDPCGGWDRRCQIFGVVPDDFFCASGKPKGGDGG